jgi:hypothetical protein
MRILAVAPAANIKNVEDWVSAANGNRITVLNRFVSVREVLGQIASGDYQIIHFATHGCTTALAMSDGDIPMHLLQDALRAAGNVELVILGACDSIAIGAELYKAGVPRVLSWRVEVEDAIAATWARTFYSALHMSHDIWGATQTAGETIENLNAEPPIYLNGRLVTLEAEVRRLTAARQRGIGGVPAWLFGVLGMYGVVLAALLVLLAQLTR